MKVGIVEKGSIVAFFYTNWKGVTESRMAIVLDFKYGTNEFYSNDTTQFFMYAFCLDRKSERSFTIANIKNLIVKGNVYEVMSYLSEGTNST